MSREICKFNKYGYCKFGNKCRQLHNNVTCESKQCKRNVCDKRHPNKCYYYSINNYCKFGSFCRYVHENNEENLKIVRAKVKKLENTLIEQFKVIENLQSELDKKSKTVEVLENKVELLESQLEGIHKENLSIFSKCTLCKYSFETKRMLSSHMQKAHKIVTEEIKNKSETCEMCNKTFVPSNTWKPTEFDEILCNWCEKNTVSA